ncbi:MAG TPA: hypothetical protein VNM22_14560 [Candidatus Limnocylindrales bacterium]|nr:hypothetical protein [Candidatus Limnocylindrales bacterium]
MYEKTPLTKDNLSVKITKEMIHKRRYGNNEGGKDAVERLSGISFKAQHLGKNQEKGGIT